MKKKVVKSSLLPCPFQRNPKVPTQFQKKHIFEKDGKESFKQNFIYKIVAKMMSTLDFLWIEGVDASHYNFCLTWCSWCCCSCWIIHLFTPTYWPIINYIPHFYISFMRIKCTLPKQFDFETLPLFISSTPDYCVLKTTLDVIYLRIFFVCKTDGLLEEKYASDLNHCTDDAFRLRDIIEATIYVQLYMTLSTLMLLGYYQNTKLG